MMGMAVARAQRKAQQRRATVNRVMNLRAYYGRKGMKLINAVMETDTGKTWVLVQRRTTIPKVTRKGQAI